MPGRKFEVISSDRCLELLRSRAIGRVAWSDPEGIRVRPVSYAVHEPDLVFRTESRDLLAELSEPHQVAFEVDRFDVGSRAAWSVVVHGLSRVMSDPVELEHPRSVADPFPLIPGTGDVAIAIAIQRISGRIVGGV